MGERKGTNKYYPPDFDPKVHRNLNAYHGVHALRERGRKADQGVIIIRFEMPFNCWCLTCKKPIGMGVRYNAEKAKVGMYHSTPIYKFTMNCAMCAGVIVMQTDPQNFDYLCMEGIRRKCQTWDPEENEQIVVPDYNERKKFALDAMYQVEHGVKDKEKASRMQPAVTELETERRVFKDDFALNCLARKRLREAKKIAKDSALMDDALSAKLSLTNSEIIILPEDQEDLRKAKLIRLMHKTYKGPAKIDRNTVNNNGAIFCEPNFSEMSTASISKTSNNSSSNSKSIHTKSSKSSSIGECRKPTALKSFAFNFVKQKVTAHRMARRIQAFSKTTDISHRNVIEKNKISTEPISGGVENLLEDKCSQPGDAVTLVAYADSD